MKFLLILPHNFREKTLKTLCSFLNKIKSSLFAKSKQSFSSNIGYQCGWWWMVYIHSKANWSKALEPLKRKLQMMKQCNKAEWM
jgi:hypothetical protein